MRAYLRWVAGAALVLGAAAIPAGGWLDWTHAKDYQQEQVDQLSAMRQTQDVVASWPDGARILAWDMIEEYGVPDQVLPFRLSWKDKAPWRRIELSRDASTRTQADNLMQAVAYDAPVGRWRALSALDCGVTYDAVAKELVSRSDSEELNFLALNVADEVIRGKRAPDEGRAFYDTTVELSYSGKSSRYMRGLRFKPAASPR